MKSYKFKKLLDLDGWKNDAIVTVDDKGHFLEFTDANAAEEVEEFEGWALPGVPNAHSHAFQFAMAGQAEHLPKEAQGDDFWSWRKSMYQLANSMTPEHLQEYATELYRDMVEHGYTSVAEFHYLHHQQDGTSYASQTEMAERLLEAAQEAEIHLTVVPVYYQTGNFGADASEHQKRFLFNDADHYLTYLEVLKTKVKNYDGARIGCGVHSLRAAPKESIEKILAATGELPFHIHVAEQTKEVEDCVSHYGARPVQWLLNEFDINDRFHLVHSTHVDESELQGIVSAGAHVVLCPTTEANLGDGIFPLKDFHHMGGKWSIGSDSQVCRNPFEELRWADYTQRLLHRVRNPLCKSGGPSSGEELLRSAIRNGRAACGIPVEFFKKGEVFDVMTFAPEETIDTIVFA